MPYSAICSREASRAPGYKGIARQRPATHKEGWLILGLRPTVENGERSDSTEAWGSHPKSDCPPSARRWQWSRARRRSLGMEIVIGVDPHKATNAVAAIDKQGELV